MTAAVVVPLVLAAIYLARGRLGDATYDRVVITIFKALFLTVGSAILCIVIYNRFFR
jgi:hypothetical protein